MHSAGEEAAEQRQQAAGKLRVDQQRRNGDKTRIGNSRSQNRKQPNQQPVEPETLFGEARGDEAAKGG